MLRIEALIEKLDQSIRSQLDAREALIEAKDILENGTTLPAKNWLQHPTEENRQAARAAEVEVLNECEKFIQKRIKTLKRL